MNNYLIAFTLFFICLLGLNCSRSSAKFSSQEFNLVDNLKDSLPLEGKYFVGDTLSFVYSSSQPFYDTIVHELSHNKSLKFLGYEEKGPPQEVLFARMDISEIESQRRYIFKFKARKAGSTYLSIHEQVKDPQAIISGRKRTWKLVVEKR